MRATTAELARAYKAREARIRRQVVKRGFFLERCRSRTPAFPSYGHYAVMDPNGWRQVNPSRFRRWFHSWTLDDVEDWLAGRASLEDWQPKGFQIWSQLCRGRVASPEGRPGPESQE